MADITLEKTDVSARSGQIGYKVLDGEKYIGRVVKAHDGTFEARTRGIRGRGVKVAEGLKQRKQAVDAVVAAA